MARWPWTRRSSFSAGKLMVFAHCREPARYSLSRYLLRRVGYLFLESVRSYKCRVPSASSCYWRIHPAVSQPYPLQPKALGKLERYQVTGMVGLSQTSSGWQMIANRARSAPKAAIQDNEGPGAPEPPRCD